MIRGYYMALLLSHVSFLGTFSEHVTKSYRYMAVSADHSATARVIIHDYCAQHAQEIDGLRCWEPITRSLKRRWLANWHWSESLNSCHRRSAFFERRKTFSNGNSPELARLGDDRKFVRTHVHVHVFEARMYPVHASTEACRMLVTTVTARCQHP